KSAIKAGFSKKSAGKIATELMQIPQIKNAVGKAVDKALWKAEVSVERILREYEVLAFQKIPDYLKMHKDGSITLKSFTTMKNGTERAIAGITEDTWITKGKGGDALLHKKVTYKFHDKLRALEALAKFKQMLIQRIDISGEMTLKPKFDLEELRKSYVDINGAGRKKPRTKKS
ncbi:unnamed protein product, partial [marine sediment metagenome]